MPFQKDNEYRITTGRPLAGRIDLRLPEDVASKVKAIPGWRDVLREMIENLVKKKESDFVIKLPYILLKDSYGNGVIAQGEGLVYDDLSFASRLVQEQIVKLLNEGKGESGWDELLDYLINNGCVESASGCLRMIEEIDPEDFPRTGESP